MRIRLVGFLAALLFLIPTASAVAAIVPPGNSAATQYSESVPGAGGEETRPEAGGGDRSSTGKAAGEESVVPAATAAELKRLGPEGEAALRLANQGPRPSKAAKRHGNEGGAVATDPGTPGGPGSGSGGSSGVGEVLGGAAGTSSGGLGFLQPLILAAVLVGAGAYLLRRRRSGSATQA